MLRNKFEKSLFFSKLSRILISPQVMLLWMKQEGFLDMSMVKIKIFTLFNNYQKLYTG